MGPFVSRKNRLVLSRHHLNQDRHTPLTRTIKETNICSKLSCSVQTSTLESTETIIAKKPTIDVFLESIQNGTTPVTIDTMRSLVSVKWLAVGS
ncbi:unnamed protein product [Caenorhabditis brenneri]